MVAFCCNFPNRRSTVPQTYTKTLQLAFKINNFSCIPAPSQQPNKPYEEEEEEEEVLEEVYLTNEIQQHSAKVKRKKHFLS